jgi:IS5 family transposase
LVAAVFLGFYVERSYRDLEEWLLASESICRALGFEQVPHYSTLCRSFQQLTMAQLRLLMRHLLRWLGVSENAMVVDSTGLMMHHASQHYLSRSGRIMSKQIC